MMTRNAKTKSSEIDVDENIDVMTALQAQVNELTAELTRFSKQREENEKENNLLRSEIRRLQQINKEKEKLRTCESIPKANASVQANMPTIENFEENSGILGSNGRDVWLGYENTDSTGIHAHDNLTRNRANSTTSNDM